MTVRVAGSKRKSFAAIAALITIAAVASAIAQARASGKTDAVVTARASSLRDCLLGGPLAPAETRVGRLRSVEIGQAPTDGADDPAGSWPMRCERNAEAMAHALREGPPAYLHGARGRLLTLTEALFSADTGAARSVAELSIRLDAWEAQIVSAGLPSADPDAEPEPGAASFRRAELTGPLPMTSASLGGGSQYAHAGLLLPAGDPRHEIAIVDGHASQARLLAVKDRFLPPFSASGDAATLFLPQKTNEGLALVDNQGATLWRGPGEVFAHATVRGGFYVACGEKDGCRLVTLLRRGDGYEPRSEAALPRDQTHALVNGVLVSRAKTEDPESLFVSFPDQPGSPRVALGPKTEPFLRLRVCRTPKRTVLAAQGVERTTFFFHDGDAWSEGQVAKAPDFDAIAGPQAQLACDEDGASVVSREEDALALLRCTARGCERSVTRPLPGIRDLAFAAVGEKLLTARVVDSAGGYAPSRGVWFRFGRPEGLHVNEGLLLGDGEHGGHSVGFIGAYPMANGAVLALSALGSVGRGTFLLSVDREGRFTKIAFD